MNFLAIDIGGTKFTLALFDASGRMTHRESRATDRDGGPRWMAARFPEIVASWGVNAIANSSYGNQTNLVFPNSIKGGAVVDPKSNPTGYLINLPTADAQAQKEQPNEINVVVTASGDVMVNKVPVTGRNVDSISVALRRAAGEGKEPVVIINADAKASHQSVIDVMQAAQQSGLSHISFATQQTQR